MHQKANKLEFKYLKLQNLNYKDFVAVYIIWVSVAFQFQVSAVQVSASKIIQRDTCRDIYL